MAKIYCAKKKALLDETEIDKDYCEEHCSMVDTCLSEGSKEEPSDPEFEFSEEEDWDDDSDINNHEDDDD